MPRLPRKDLRSVSSPTEPSSPTGAKGPAVSFYLSDPPAPRATPQFCGLFLPDRPKTLYSAWKGAPYVKSALYGMWHSPFSSQPG